MSEQITVTIVQKEGKEPVRLRHPAGELLLDTLREGGYYPPSLCGSLGKCGRCGVKFLSCPPLPTQTDRALLPPDKLREGYRLSCMARPVKDCRIALDFTVKKEEAILASSVFDKKKGADCIGKKSKSSADSDTVMAVDLGTTTIAMQLLLVQTGEVLADYACPNPQSCYGTDVMERIRVGSTQKAPVLKELAREAVRKGREAFCRTAEGKKLNPPGLLCIAGNTAMGHLFMGYSTGSLGKSPFFPVDISLIDFEWDGFRTVLVPGFSAFVGGDILAGLLATGLHNENENWLFLDLGTNAEMVIGCKGRLFATAAAAGPAFEGGNRPGSKRLNAAAQLLKKGVADTTGLLKEPYFETGAWYGDTFLGQQDIREIQMAKAAVRAGIHFLKEKASLSDYESIGKVYLAGGLGFYLDKEAAAILGLIPGELKDKTVAVGNTSLYGAGILGRSMASGSFDGESLYAMIDSCQVFNLALEENFQDFYIKYMDFPKRY